MKSPIAGSCPPSMLRSRTGVLLPVRRPRRLPWPACLRTPLAFPSPLSRVCAPRPFIRMRIHLGSPTSPSRPARPTYFRRWRIAPCVPARAHRSGDDACLFLRHRCAADEPDACAGDGSRAAAWLEKREDERGMRAGRSSSWLERCCFGFCKEQNCVDSL